MNIMTFHPLFKFPFGSIHIKFHEFKFIQRPFVQFTALIFHELTHYFEWCFIAKLDSNKWNDFISPEKRADKIQDVILKTLLLGQKLK